VLEPANQPHTDIVQIADIVFIRLLAVWREVMSHADSIRGYAHHVTYKWSQ
jgi:hypothetical protein